MQTEHPRIIALIDDARKDFLRIWRGGVLHLAASSFLVRSSALIQRILLARILGAENIGHIAVVTATLSIIRLPAGVGTFTVVNKLVAENHDDLRAQKTVVGTSLWINLFTTLVIGACAWFVLNNTTWVNDPVANRLLSVLVFLLPLMIFTEVFRNALMGQRRMRVVAGIDITLALAAIFVVIPMAYVWSISGWFANQLLIIVLGFALFAWFLRRLLSLNYSRAIAKRVFVIGGFAFLGQLVGALILQFDTLAISNMLGDPALTGIYSTASLLAQQLIVFPGALLTVVFPIVAQNRDNLGGLKKRYWELFRKLSVVSISISLVMWVISPWIFPLFGNDFSSATEPFQVLVLGFTARSLYILNNTYLDALGRTDITFASGLAAAIVTVVLNLAFIPMWGIMGAAWATTISILISFVLRQAAVQYFIFTRNAVR